MYASMASTPTHHRSSRCLEGRRGDDDDNDVQLGNSQAQVIISEDLPASTDLATQTTSSVWGR